MLNTLKPDLVSVCTGGYEYCSDHYEPTMQALNTGCHVLTEKPIADTIERAREMVETAEKNHRCFALDFNHRFTDAGRQAKKWQEEGRLGDLLFCNMALWIGKPEDYPSPYYHLKALNPHSIDIIRYFMGDIEAVQCFAMKSPGRTIWSTSSMNFKFRNGCVGHLTSSYDIKRGHPMERCEVAGLKGRIVFEDMWRRSTLYPAGDNVILQYNNPVFDGPDRYNVFEEHLQRPYPSFRGAGRPGRQPGDDRRHRPGRSGGPEGHPRRHPFSGYRQDRLHGRDVSRRRP